MISLAFDTATDRCTVAASFDGTVRVSHAFVDGARRHAAAIIGLIDDVLREIGGASADIACVIIGDGPGSFTGLRVAASGRQAALAWRSARVEWRVAPSLLVRATAHTPPGGGKILALSDALRGELFAGCWRFGASGVERDGAPPRAVTPESLATFHPVDVVVGSIPAALVDRVREATGRVPIVGDAALPDARMLLTLAGMPGGTLLVADPAAWEPDYGRPAEAQAVWERTHGTELPAAPRIAR